MSRRPVLQLLEGTDGGQTELRDLGRRALLLCQLVKGGKRGLDGILLGQKWHKNDSLPPFLSKSYIIFLFFRKRFFSDLKRLKNLFQSRTMPLLYIKEEKKYKKLMAVSKFLKIAVLLYLLAEM